MILLVVLLGMIHDSIVSRLKHVGWLPVYGSGANYKKRKRKRKERKERRKEKGEENKEGLT
jgi:hypothetical protein